MKTDNNILSKKQLALGTWEVHLQTDHEQHLIFNAMRTVCNYVDTAIDYNNDYILQKYLSLGYKIITKIAPCHFQFYDFFVDNHLKCLKKDSVDIMLIHSSRGDWKPLAQRLESDIRFKEVGVSNFNSNELEEYKQLIGHFPAYNEVEINPYYTDVSTIEFCKKNGIKIIAYGIFGGKYNAMANIADFSVQYLIKYAAEFADILILKPECERHVDEIIDIVQNYDLNDTRTVVKILDEHDRKAVVPMRYTAKDIQKFYKGRQTYVNACGKNNCAVLERLAFDNDVPQFEMLGDYMAYLRYSCRTKYDGTKVYDYDFLIGDDGNYYVVYLYDSKGRISKINETGKVEFAKYKRQ